jgi:hypothetical protein
MELIRDFWEWVVAVFEHWHGYVGGGIVAFVLDNGDRLFDWKPQRKWIVEILIAGFLGSIFSSWRDKKRGLDEANKKLNDSLPQLKIELGMVVHTYEQQNDRTIFILSGNIINAGAPTIVPSWIATYTVDGKSEPMNGLYFIDSYSIIIGREKLTLINDNLLSAQVIAKQITRGDGKVGRLVFTVPGNRIQDIEGNKFRILVECFDYLGKKSSAIFAPDGNASPKIHFFPGEKLEILSDDNKK